MATTAAPVESLVFGVIPPGREAEFIKQPDERTLAAADFLLDRFTVDSPHRLNSISTFVRHAYPHYDVVSSLNPTESEGLYRASSLLILKEEFWDIGQYLGETHLYNPHDTHPIEPEHVKPLDAFHERPFLKLGAMVTNQHFNSLR